MLENPEYDFSAIRTQLKACDKESYLSALFVGGSHTQSLWTLYAFHCELAKISSIVQESMLGKMRLQWWRDVINKAYEKPKVLCGHPVADHLSQIITHYNLKPTLFEKIIDARACDLGTRFFSSQQDFDDYHDAVWGNLYRLAYEIRGQVDRKISDQKQDLTALDEPLFKAAGCVTAMIKFLCYADSASLTSHMQMSLGQSDLSLCSEGIEHDELFQDYKQGQIKLIYKKLDFITQRLSDFPNFDDRVLLGLTLVPSSLSQWEKDEQALNMPDTMNPLKQFWILWRGSQQGLYKTLKNIK